MKISLFYLLLGLLTAIIDCGDVPQNANNIATTATVNSSTISNANTVLDGDFTTCLINNETGKGVSIVIDLGSKFIISGLYVSAGQFPGAALGRFEVYISSDAMERGDICKVHSPNSNKDDYFKCSGIKAGRYVTLVNPRTGGLELCEVQVYECKSGFYGQDCTAECHCGNEAEVCPIIGGACQSGCTAGWMGLNCNTSCDTVKKYGENCAYDCHCKGDCDEINGHCSGGCADGWLGDDCQTGVPSLMGVSPEREQATFNSISLRWSSWNGTIGEGFSLLYKIKFMEYLCNTQDCWQDVEVPHSPGIKQQVGTVDRTLKINTRYKFQVVPILVQKNEEQKIGHMSNVVGPFKTNCIAPEAPLITNLNSTVDKTIQPYTATLIVKWKPPDGIHCDDISLYKILYSRSNTSIWEVEKAGNRATSKEIPGLKFNAEFRVSVVAVNNENLEGRSNLQKFWTVAQSPTAGPPPGEASSNTGVILGVISVCLFVAVIIIIFFVWRVRRKRYNSLPKKDPEEVANGTLDNTTSFNMITKMEKEHTPTNDSGVLVEGPCSHTPSSSAESFQQIKDPPSVKPAAKLTPEPPRKPIERFPIKVEDLEDYVMERRDNDCKALKEEYREFPEGIQKPCEHGRKQENKHKNRFINIIAYDHSRVPLEPMEGDEDSDYINANFIHGYEKPNHYIASQGCNKWTIQDIWRLNWQLNSHRIVMVTNLVESGKRKCEQYWPEHMNEDKQYNEIFVKWIDCEQTSDFVIRTFELRKGEETRNVKQFHFTAWPDHGVPSRASPILAFRRKVRSFDESHPGKMVIHCSAGVGRTGTFIAIDYNLEMAKDKGVVEVHGVTKEMRDSRVNMIQTEEQYIFVYDALLESLHTGDTAIPCSEFRTEFELLCKEDEEDGKSKIQKEFENLQSVSPKVTPEDCEAAAKADNVDKNRGNSILPADRHRPYLNSRVQGTNDYINAVFLDGYKSRNAHIITQMPLPITVIDFWRMCYEHNCGSIVMLNRFDPNDETSGQYWPEDAACECGPFIIEPVELDEKNQDIVVRELKLTYQSKSSNLSRRGPEVRTVNLFQYQAWPKEDNLPTNKTSLMSLIDLVERSQYKTGNGPVLIHCYNGASQSGLYAAISCIWEKMKLEQEVDIYHTVKQLRYHRPEVIENLEQYKFCFEMVLAFLAEFETYANFT